MHPAANGIDDTGRDLQNRRLATAGRAKQRHGFPGRNAEIEILEQAAAEKGVADLLETEGGMVAHRLTPHGSPAARQRSSASRSRCSRP